MGGAAACASRARAHADGLRSECQVGEHDRLRLGAVSQGRCRFLQVALLRGLKSPVGGGRRLCFVDDDGSLLLTIGQLASRTGLAVRTIRYWSDSGAVPPAGRSSGGHRLYDAESVARLELVATLRELGLGLDEVARVLAREATVADAAAAHVAALDAQIRSLRLTRAVLSAVARRDPGNEEMTLMNKLARLSAAERRQIIEDFIAEVFAGLDADPGLRDKLRLTTPELPDEPTGRRCPLHRRAGRCR
jgi:DNA-binding transcriptional MerR regulator